MDQLLGQVLQERYAIQSLLGSKAGRRTFLAQDLQTQSQVVIKLLLFGVDFVWDDLKLFEREAETLKSLSSPAIPQYLDFFDIETPIGQGFALVQSYISARSLQDWVEAGRSFSEADLREITLQLLAILEYLHCRQPPVIHRDLKPSNILLADRSAHSPGQIYLVDFGSVQTVAHSGTMTIVGTYGYMPPEQFGGRALPASDLYSLGMTLIYLATGRHPADLPEQDMQVQFEQFTSLSPAFRQWLRQITTPSLSRRLSSAQTAIQQFQSPPAQSLVQQSAPIASQKRSNSTVQVFTTLKTCVLKVPVSQGKFTNLEYTTNTTSPRQIMAGVLSLFPVFLLTHSWLISTIVALIVTFRYRSIDKRAKRAYSEAQVQSAHLPVTAQVPLEIELRRERHSVTLRAKYKPKSTNSATHLEIKNALRPDHAAGVIFQQRVKSIFAEVSEYPGYRLNFVFHDPNTTLLIAVHRSEIESLCEQLRQWTEMGIQVQHLRPPLEG